jgi:hypothetical protein
MALNWDAKKAANWKLIGDAEKEKSLVFGTMTFGINPITEENHEEYFRRHAAFYRAKGYPPFLALADIRNAIGLSTNASRLSNAAWKKRLLEVIEQETTQMLAAEKRAPQPAPEQEDRPTYKQENRAGSHIDGIPNLYLYEFSDGRAYRHEEKKDIVKGGFRQSVYRTDGAKRVKVTMRELKAAIAGADRSEFVQGERSKEASSV